MRAYCNRMALHDSPHRNMAQSFAWFLYFPKVILRNFPFFQHRASAVPSRQVANTSTRSCSVTAAAAWSNMQSAVRRRQVFLQFKQQF